LKESDAERAAIRDLAARFADAATRADYETIRSLFTTDAVFTIGEPFAVTCRGPNEIVALIHMQILTIELDGNTASARWLVHGKERSRKELLQQFRILHFEKVDGWVSRRSVYRETDISFT
jgi:ketosteroid isomerase-like protein